MTQPAWRNGEFVSADQLTVSVLDSGFLLGATVSEQLRTFGGRLFQLEQHLQRLARSLQIIGIDGVNMAAIRQAAEQLADRNHALLQPGDDLSLSLFVTPGVRPAGPAEEATPTVGMNTAPLAFHRWSPKYRSGEVLVTSSVRQIPANCWPAELKCRSRMHYFLADREASQIRPGARALLLDQQGFVSEASTAGIVLCRAEEGLVTPQKDKVLPSVSVEVVASLAGEIGLDFQHRDLTVDDVISADEIYLCSTSPCLLPVVAVDDTQIGRGVPGPVFHQLMSAWSHNVGVDILKQAAQFSSR